MTEEGAAHVSPPGWQAGPGGTGCCYGDVLVLDVCLGAQMSASATRLGLCHSARPPRGEHEGRVEEGKGEEKRKFVGGSLFLRTTDPRPDKDHSRSRSGGHTSPRRQHLPLLGHKGPGFCSSSPRTARGVQFRVCGASWKNRGFLFLVLSLRDK